MCARWQLPCTAIGKVTDDGQLRCRWDGEVVGDMPADVLTDAPRYPLHAERPAALAEQSIAAADVPAVDDGAALLLRLLAAPNICAKTWVYEQYDQVVGSGTVARPGSDAGVVRLTPSDRAIAVALDGDGARVALDPRRGGAEAVAQAALNVACSGAEPAAITNCLNFGNPERPGTAYALREAITGMAEACEVLGTPVVSGNVSLYNESGGRPIHPTPVVGCVGVLERADAAVRIGARRRERHAAPAGRRRCPSTTARSGRRWSRARLPGAYPRSICPRCAGSRDLLSGLAREGGLLRSAHDASDGGLAVALAELALAAGTGVEVTLEPRGERRRRRSSASAAGSSSQAARPEDEANLIEACDVCRRASRENRRPGRCGDRAALWRADASTCRWRRRARRTRARSRRPWRPSDVRRLRHPRARARRRAARVLRALRAPAPRPGERGHRRLRRPPGAHGARHGARRAGLRRGQAAGATRPRGDRPRALLDDRIGALDELAADRRPPARTHGCAGAQRQPHQHDRAARGADGAGREARLDLRHRGHLRAHRASPGVARRGRGARHGAHPRRVLRGRAERGHAARLPRSRRHPPARARRPRRLAGRGLRDPGARHHRRDRDPRAAARRAPDLRHGGLARDPGGAAAPQRDDVRVRAHLLRAARRQDGRPDAATPSASAWASGSRSRHPSRPTS